MRAVHQATVPVRRPRVSPRRVLDVEAALLWAYSKQKVDLVEAAPIDLHEQEAKVSRTKWNGFAKCGCYRLEQIAQFGDRVDGYGPTIAEAHPDAIVLHQSVMALSREPAALVIQYAKPGTQPERDIAPRIQPLRWEHG